MVRYMILNAVKNKHDKIHSSEEGFNDLFELCIEPLTLVLSRASIHKVGYTANSLLVHFAVADIQKE